MMLREVKPRNPRTARILKAREPQLLEHPKRILLLHGPKCPFPLRTILKTFHSLTHPHSILFHKKNENIHPFENTESLEFLAAKNDCGLVVWGSSNKKRPNCITMVRIFDSKVLEMCELLLLGTQEQMEKEIADRGNGCHTKLNIGLGMKPMMLFLGSLWDDPASPVFGMLKHMFLDIFKIEETARIDVEGLQYLLLVALDEPREGTTPTLHLRWYRILTKKSGQKLPRVELDEIGTKFDFRVGRVREPDQTSMKEAMKQGKKPQYLEKTKKNISMDSIGDKIGRVHLGRQDLGGLQTRKMKGLKRMNGVEDEGDDVDMMELDETAKGDVNKRPRMG
ncbi:rRNA-binding ribosome biosynthesis protein rpf2 [Ophidiomyces ophidiicola]|nr:rRNA-binding ribosome biosynthesis protein rpf2 [Ophidiomyces ophidiicola]KAI1935277.1 rRNA-binding ribosome biosynthesis protein rpf2 [Ophidiomyces ophidiicola]KAI2032724.1 rRNA-binding ribosome biosynthesis protein rpf2 [Ophidiomyces ophidiicola]KAI2050645.1 rRNA-binding ribosome biosynthesis protein rpf2 [Ophidiomyces ophidiicola]KAI2075293.1 rRNA-binding ribosome biosynthesis protein rpf2 [Ophidiomyces ophidiicola]